VSSDAGSVLVDVALPVPVAHTFTYSADAGSAAPGTRVRVPFGNRRLIGWVVGPAATPVDASHIRSVDRALESSPSVSPDLLALCRWIADYYVVPIGLVLRAALPIALSDSRRAAEPARMRKIVSIRRELPSLLERDALFARAPRQRACYESLEASGGSAPLAQLVERLGFSAAVIKGLVDKGIVVLDEQRQERDPFRSIAVAPPAVLRPTAAQQVAIDAVLTAARDRGAAPAAPFLLLGVTGSGKTLVYTEILREIVMEQGRGAIVLVPEIALTPQTVARFRAQFGDVVAVLHSGLSDGERFDAWRALREGERRIAIGARSAIFAPVRDLGAIIVDEEHEATYKQSESPRYHARDAALMRARFANAVCVLGSATPALESWHNVERSKYTLLELPQRVEGRPLPVVEIVDLRAASGESKETARTRPILSEPLRAAITDRLARREQIILLLNRRGYATFVQCRACGAVWHCAQCNVSLTYHRGRRRLVCHYCFHEEAPPTHCDACGSGDLSFRGVGTEQVEREVAERFPAARIARMDVDTTSGKWAHHEILGRVERGDVDILLGTQMIAKGLDFPMVTLVGVVNADVAMNLPDFRATERTFQLLTQVAGRAGRGERVGRVLVQTALPDHYAIRCAIQHDYRTFAERELDERTETGYPPLSRMANVVISSSDEAATQQAAEHAAEWTRAAARDHGAVVRLTGPAPCPIDRIRGRWRWHFLLRADTPPPLSVVCQALQNSYTLKPGRAELRLVLDRDPVSLL
jgi:primosomal protein N' (replication factor Y) (superfamily II helicase)